MNNAAFSSASLKGIVTALVTPFGREESIDHGAWQAMSDSMIAAGVYGLLAAGSQGEFFCSTMPNAPRRCASAAAP